MKDNVAAECFNGGISEEESIGQKVKSILDKIKDGINKAAEKKRDQQEQQIRDAALQSELQRVREERNSFDRNLYLTVSISRFSILAQK